MILVTGATGLIGRHLVPRLLAEGLPVRVILPLRAPALRHIPWLDQVTITPGTIHNPSALHQAMSDVHTVFHLASAQWWGRRRDLERIDMGGTASVITAARASRIGRIILMSHLGAAPSSAFTLMRVKGRVEDAVRASGLAYTIVRSGIVFGVEDRFVNGIAAMLRGNPAIFVQPGAGDNLLHPIFIDDLTEALFRSLETLNTVDRTIEIGGAEYVTYNEMVRTVMRVTGAPRAIVSIPPYMMRRLTGTIHRVLPRWPITPQWYDILASNRTAGLGNLYDLFGIRPVRFEDTIVGYMRGRHYAPEMFQAVLRRRVGHA